MTTIYHEFEVPGWAGVLKIKAWARDDKLDMIDPVSYAGLKLRQDDGVWKKADARYVGPVKFDEQKYRCRPTGCRGGPIIFGLDRNGR